MILRRIKAHVEKENWFAVGIDFCIVVIGVFIGIQVANWNDAQSNKAGLTASLQRLDKEVTQNINIIDTVLIDYVEGEADRNLGRTALNSCTYSPEAQAALENLLFDYVADVLPNFVTVALDQLAAQVRYQDLLSEEFQEDFGVYAGRLKEEHEQLTSHYDKMWLYHVNYHPSVTAFFPSESETDSGDWGFALNKPFNEVCEDSTFRTRFINTIGFYQAINSRLTRLKGEVETFQQSLAEEMGRQP